MIAAGAVIPNKKLKIKFAPQRIEAVPGTQSCESGQQLSLDENWHYTTSVEGNQVVMSKSHCLSDGRKMIASEDSKERSSVAAANKRGAQEKIEGPKEKRLKMHRGVTHECSMILKSLMILPTGWVFNQPVDPVKLNILDYFSIVSKPMDLGTIKTKLHRNLYIGTEEFVADVRLTFSNAMLYNPPENNVHKMAQELNSLFDMKWKSLEEKWICEGSKLGLGKISSGKMIEANNKRKNCPATHPQNNTFSSKKSKTSKEKALRSSYCSRAIEIERPKPVQNMSCKIVVKSLHTGTDDGDRLGCNIVNAKPPLSPVACKRCGKGGRTTCGCNVPIDSTRASSGNSSDITSESGDRAYSADASKPDCQAKSTSTSQMSKSDPYSGGAVSAFNDGNACPSSCLVQPATDSASAEEWTTPLLDVQMSPKKALRAAMLKSRFADTIFKAKQKTLLDQGDKADPAKMQQEKERLERRRREEKVRIETQIEAAEAASRMKAESELKKQREKEREAARIALQKMERTVEIEHNLEILKEFEMLSGCCLYPHLLNGERGAFKGAHSKNPLERIGLFMKNDYLGDDDEEILNLVGDGDGEEGEIF